MSQELLDIFDETIRKSNAELGPPPIGGSKSELHMILRVAWEKIESLKANNADALEAVLHGCAIHNILGFWIEENRKAILASTTKPGDNVASAVSEATSEDIDDAIST